MTTISEQILAHWQVRKTRKQKDAFIRFIQEHYPDLKVEQGGFGNNKNLVLGDIASARVIFTAHYDTCSRMPVPNFLAPKNIAASIGYALLLCIPTAFVIVIIRLLLELLTDNSLVLYWVSYLGGMVALLLLLAGGPPNPHTVNDNTSGVITLCELIGSLSEQERKTAAFVFFDNEEYGLFGSSFFAKYHKKEDLKQKPVLNFDCVSDGDHILLVQSSSVQKAWGSCLEAAFPSTEGKHIHLEKSSKAIYPSDQINFPMGVGIAAMKHKRGVGLYLDRIHTARDTVFREENINYLVRCSKAFLSTVQEVNHEA